MNESEVFINALQKDNSVLSSDQPRRRFPLARAVLTIVTVLVLVASTYSTNYQHENPPHPSHIPFKSLVFYSTVVMSVVGLLNAALFLWTWQRIRGATARGLLLAATGALTGVVGGACIGSMEWQDDGNASISRAAGAVGVGFINMVVWAIGGAVGGESNRPGTSATNGGVKKSLLPKLSFRQGLVGLAILICVAGAVALFDRVYFHAYTAKPPRGLTGWGLRAEGDYRNRALADLAFHHVLVLSTILLGLWVARRIAEGRANGFLPVAVVMLLLFGLLALVKTMFMLGKIVEP